MKKVTLSDGRELSLDFSKVTTKEMRLALSTESTTEDTDAVLAKIAGVTYTELIEVISFLDYKAIGKAILDNVRNPLEDPN
jgi:hypothetical protein